MKQNYGNLVFHLNVSYGFIEKVIGNIASFFLDVGYTIDGEECRTKCRNNFEDGLGFYCWTVSNSTQKATCIPTGNVSAIVHCKQIVGRKKRTYKYS